MPERLTPLDVSLLALDTVSSPAHVGSVAVFQLGPDDDQLEEFGERLVGLVEQRLSFVPRYRQRVQTVPLRLGGPVWVDDDTFDLTYHVRRAELPQPGTLEQLRDFADQVLAGRLDRSRPLWELYLVRGLQDRRFAVVTKSHLSLVDGIDTVEIGQVLLDSSPEPAVAPPVGWHPLPPPRPLELVTSAVWRAAQDPAVTVQNVRGLVTEALGVAVTVGDVVGVVGEALGDLAAGALRGGRPPSASPLAGMLAEQRRTALVSVALADLQAVHVAHSVPVHDVVLAVVTGGLRAWLLTRTETVGPSTSVTALLPMSVPEDLDAPTALGSSVAAHPQRLPVGEPDPLTRLHEIASASRARSDPDRTVSARSLTELAGFAPPTLHALAMRAGAERGAASSDLVLANVPGPQLPRYAAGAELVASYPLLPLTRGHSLAVGATSYQGQLHLGLTGRDTLGDLDVLASCLRTEVQELLSTTRTPTARRRPRSPSGPARRPSAKRNTAKRTPAERASAGPATTTTPGVTRPADR